MTFEIGDTVETTSVFEPHEPIVGQITRKVWSDYQRGYVYKVHGDGFSIQDSSTGRLASRLVAVN